MGGPGSGRRPGSGNKSNKEKDIMRQSGMHSNGTKVIKNNGMYSSTKASYKANRKTEGGKGRSGKRTLALWSRIRTGKNG